MSANQDAISLTSHADTRVGIVVALPEELATLTPIRLKQGECCQVGSTWIAYSGAGLSNAANAAELLTTKGVQLLISWGCAAGLSEQAKPGDLIIASQVIGEDEYFDADKPTATALQQLLPANLTVHDGKLFTSSTLINLSLDKQRIHQQFQADALDMESAAIAQIAQRAQLPFLVIRSIADPVNMDLPHAVSHALDSNGQVALAKLLRYLCWHPWEIKALIRLGWHFKAAQNTLKIVARELQQPKMHPFWLAT